MAFWQEWVRSWCRGNSAACVWSCHCYVASIYQRADQQVDDVPKILLPMISAAAYLEDKDHFGGYVERLLKAHPDFNLSELRIWPLKRASDWEHFVAGLRRAGLT